MTEKLAGAVEMANRKWAKVGAVERRAHAMKMVKARKVKRKPAR